MPLHNVRCTVCLSVEEELLRSDEVPPCRCGGQRTRTMEGIRFYVAGQLMVENPYGNGQVTEQEAKEMVSARTGTPVRNLSVHQPEARAWNEKADKLRQDSLNEYKLRGVHDEKTLQEVKAEGKARMEENNVTAP